ncbi:MAG: YegS/Rv2252/BmrU family lipid kinase [Cloacibacterium sp.]|nr:YegS/Rv2252/BmrU family lipid kinase [Cloacibacterium sp.]
MERVAFIINPFSSKKNYHPFLNELKKKVENPLFIVSESIEHTLDFIQENFDKVDVFVAMGGDGTISTVARQIIDTEKILAVFPAGSGNGFANETHFDKDITALFSKIKQRQHHSIDTFLVNNHFSINVSGVGFDAEVAKNFEKTSRGFSNYIKTTINTFFKYQPISIVFEEKYQEHNGEYLMVNIANTRQFGNNAYIAPLASTTDGLVDVVLVKKMPFVETIPFALKMFNKTLKDNEYLTYISTKEISFSVNSNTWHLDGEYKEVNAPVTIKVLPKSLRILI